MQILVINDSKLTLTALSGLLAAQGFDVLTALDGREGLDILEKTACRIVLLDWEMPVMDGPEFCRAVRERFYSRYVYIVFLTSHDDLQKKLDGFEAGADDFVVRTSSSEEMLRRLRIARRIVSEDACSMTAEAIQAIFRCRNEEVNAYAPRVAEYGRALLQYLTTTEKYRNVIDSAFRRHFFLAAPLYDIGRVGLSDEILLTKSRLATPQFDLLKTHPVIGGRIFEELIREYPATPFLDMARDVAATHHERYDGSGYPHGLKGEAIPLVGRIMFLADSYDALTSEGRGRKPYSHDFAKWLIMQGRRIHFDPDVVDGFLACENAFAQTSSRERSEIEIEL